MNELGEPGGQVPRPQVPLGTMGTGNIKKVVFGG